MGKQSDERYSDEEAEERREAALRRMLSTPHKLHEPIGSKNKGRKNAKLRGKAKVRG